jgi:phage regulator Rha-like protein
MKNKIIKIENLIYEIRGQKVMVDKDLAALYEVEVKRLNESVKRNIERFPLDFMFQLTQNECDSLRSQIATSKNGHGGRRYLPYVFTEHGVLMLSNVLNSEKAIAMSIQIIRVFDKLRKYALSKTTKDTQIEELRKLLMLHIENSDSKFLEHNKKISQIIIALNKLIEQPKQSKPIGFKTE